MAISDILELLLTFAVLILVWVVPRLVFARRRKKAAEKVAAPEQAQAPKTSRNDVYDWDEAVSERWVKRQQGMDNSGPEPSVEEAAARSARALSTKEATETDSVFTSGSYSDSNPVPQPRVSSRQGRLRQAIIWKEVLDFPKALRRDPFEDTFR